MNVPWTRTEGESGAGVAAWNRGTRGSSTLGLRKLGFSLLLNGNDTYTHANSNTNFITKFNTDNNSENKNNDHSRKTHNNK